MLTFLFIVLVVAALCASYYFTNKMSAQRKQILLLKYQNNNLKQLTKADKKVTIEYMYPTTNKGIVKKKCELLMSPLLNSPSLNLLKEDMLIEIHDSGKINNQVWYEVSISSNDRTNSKGWIKEDFVSLCDESNP
ncbi:hypothetical protein N4T77_12940 [Clostridium sp. CX1]|uniref:SH3b domain-containing protein n=1 Tax=Clostridium tanneri TaxID=3037988 RepID=A0ABU4JU35_9CLOT|nr:MULTISPECIES: hypothetical protein [unclassified Clostridium]MCT8977506.1 hypothetical protein [Clostridium sp. CX1]MDW8801660.1 hypothetical protein [Clostridium sp. A1-XYC3]